MQLSQNDRFSRHPRTPANSAGNHGISVSSDRLMFKRSAYLTTTSVDETPVGVLHSQNCSITIGNPTARKCQKVWGNRQDMGESPSTQACLRDCVQFVQWHGCGCKYPRRTENLPHFLVLPFRKPSNNIAVIECQIGLRYSSSDSILNPFSEAETDETMLERQ